MSLLISNFFFQLGSRLERWSYFCWYVYFGSGDRVPASPGVMIGQLERAKPGDEDRFPFAKRLGDSVESFIYDSCDCLLRYVCGS